MSITGRFLRKRRIEIGKSLADIAEEVGVSSIQFVYKCETGRNFPPHDKVHLWARAYQVSLASLKAIICEEKITKYALKYRSWAEHHEEGA